MLHSDVIKRLNERQDPGDKSDYGAVTGQDIEFIMKNFSALRRCFLSTVLAPKGPAPPLLIRTPPPSEPRECPPAPRPKRKRKPTSPLSSGMAKMRRSGYVCKSRHKGSAPSDNHLLLTREQQKEWREHGKTRVLFKGDIELLKSTLGAKIGVVKIQGNPNSVDIVRIDAGPNVPVVPFPNLETEILQSPTLNQRSVDYNNVDAPPVEIQRPLQLEKPVTAVV